MDLLEAAEIAEMPIITTRGGEHTAHCTVHDDVEPSVSINPEKDVWICYGCAVGGHGYESFLRYFAPHVTAPVAAPSLPAQDSTGAEATAARLFVSASAVAVCKGVDLTALDHAAVNGEFIRVKAEALRVLGA